MLLQQFHLQAPPGSWINDPCVSLIEETGDGITEWHIFYQLSPNHTEWTPPLMWGHASSLDGLHWSHQGIALKPDIDADRQSVFTGTGLVWKGFRGLPTAFYTGVTRLPIDWRQPYHAGAETQIMIFSDDGFRTWKRVSDTPVLARPPAEWQVTGWRDPYVFQDSRLSEMLGTEGGGYFMLLSGGLKGSGGAVFLYYSNDLFNWHHLPQPLFSGDGYEEGEELFGYNFEVASLTPITISRNQQPLFYLLTIGVERGDGSHSSWWLLGQLKCANSRYQNGSLITGCTPRFDPISHGSFDFGLLYAVAPVIRPAANSSSTTFIGWAKEDLVISSGLSAAGSIGVPREVGLSAYGDTPVLTISPAKDLLLRLKQSASKQVYYNSGSRVLIAESHNFVLEFNIIPKHHQNVSFDPVNITIHHGPTENTTIALFRSSGVVLIDRTFSSVANDSNKSLVRGRFRSKSAAARMDLIMDGTLMEIFIDRHCAITTRVYPNRTEPSGVYISPPSVPSWSLRSWYAFNNNNFDNFNNNNNLNNNQLDSIFAADSHGEFDRNNLLLLLMMFLVCFIITVQAVMRSTKSSRVTL